MKEEQTKNESNGRKVVLTAIIFFLIGFGAAWIYTRPAEAPNEKKDEKTTERIPAMDQNGVNVDDQKVGNSIFVKELKLQNAGWVAIHDDVNGAPGNILGAGWFPSGANSGTVELLRGTEQGKTYFAVLHNDDGDRVFDHKIDLPITDESGSVIMMKFMASETPVAQ